MIIWAFCVSFLKAGTSYEKYGFSQNFFWVFLNLNFIQMVGLVRIELTTNWLWANCSNHWATSPKIRMAEREGFEPSVPKRVHTLSRGAHSTTLPPFLYFIFLWTIMKSSDFSNIGGETEIRTLGILRYDSFQDCSIRPLWHLSILYKVGHVLLYIYCYVWLPRLDSNQWPND